MSGNVQLRERLSKDPSQVMVKYVIGPKIEEQFELLFEPQIQIHLAHCLMLERCGIIATDVARQLANELLALRDAGAGTLERNIAFEDLYTHIEHFLIERLGPDVAGRLHTGRSRNDLGVTVWRMVLRDWLLDVRTSLLHFWRTLLDLAERYATAVMPGYTHSQHAQPITLGYYFAAFADVIERDVRRLEAAFATNNKNPLGAAALTTTGFPIDRALTTHWLGFDGLVENGYDAVASRDDAEEASCVLAMIGVHLGRLAEDLFVWHTAEFGFIEFGDDYANVSSIMPQKKNPGLLEFTKKHSGHLIGGSTQVLAAARGAWFTDANDATDAGNDPLHVMCQSTIACLEVLAAALATMEVRQDRMEELARIGYGTMTELADTIVRESGRSFRVAHNIVGRSVAIALERGLAADQITAQLLDETSLELMNEPLGIDAEAIQAALDPAENINRRTVTGGPSATELARMLAERKVSLSQHQDALDADQQRVTDSLADLLDQASRMAKSA